MQKITETLTKYLIFFQGALGGTASESEAQKGQGLVEYALILVLVAIVAIVVLELIGVNVTNVFQQIADALG